MNIHCLINILVDRIHKDRQSSQVYKYMKLHYFSLCKLHFDHKDYFHMVQLSQVNMSLNKDYDSCYNLL